MTNKSFFIKSYGCQMNEYDSEKITSLLLKDGYSNSDDINKADLIVFNTCNIREKAAQKVYSDIGRVTKKNNNKTIALVGCVAQAENDEIFKKNKDVDIVLGPQSYHLLPKMIDAHNEYQKKQINTDFIINEKFDFIHEEKSPKGVSSYITIQEGCDKFCAFCVVPFTRGPEYSRSVINIVEETKSLIDRGTREIILLGQNVNAYSYSDEENMTYSISKLIDEISKLDGVKRIRYTTSHPNNMDQELMRLHGSNEKLMPFLHLPVQSGSDEILKNMNRKYSIDEYKKIIDGLKTYCPNIEISSDFIIGFPGETKKDFQETLALIDYVQFKQSYSFIYSERPGTKAANLEDNTLLEEKKERLEILQQKLQKIQLEFNTSFCNTNLTNVLIENQSQSNPEYYFGRSTFLQPVYVKAKNLTVGDIVPIGIETCNHKSLYGTIAH
tara:strand:+ start:567 stop:1889 length:1323 start_codon:yes stop_codon:yes gene_type:complete